MHADALRCQRSDQKRCGAPNCASSRSTTGKLSRGIAVTAASKRSMGKAL